MSNEIDELVANRSLTGNLIDIRETQPGEYDVPQLRLIRCPLPDCDYELDKWRNSRASISDHLLKSHAPEDFGLTPLREKPDPEQVVISKRWSSYIYHTSNCRAVKTTANESMKRIDFADLEAKYRHCKYCQGRSNERINL
jgi:hypothetical protein